MKVYRMVLIGSDGIEKGPYQASTEMFSDDVVELCATINDTHMDYMHPCPPENIRYGDIRQRSCCVSLEKLKEWFFDFWSELLYLGAIVREYDITPDDIIYDDGRQVLVKQIALI